MEIVIDAVVKAAKCERFMTPEKSMKKGFKYLKKARRAFNKGVVLYKERNDEKKADIENVINTTAAIHYLDEAYDEISAIWENDINI